jgi:hypothetical protein
MICGYQSDLYAQRLAGWHVHTYEAKTRGGAMATEVIWCNFPPPTQLHDYRFLGEDFRERERIRRKATRCVKRLARLPLLERQAIVAELERAGIIGGGSSASSRVAMPTIADNPVTVADAPAWPVAAGARRP